MVNCLFSFLLSTVLGFLSGMGIGGGSLLMLWLIAAAHMEPAAARTVNLAFFLPGAIVSSLFHRKQGTLPVRKLLPALVAGCIAAWVFSGLSQDLDTRMLRKLFGFLLLAVGLRELFYRPRNMR